MDISCICRACLNQPELNCASIYSFFESSKDASQFNHTTANEAQIIRILDDLTGHKYSANEFPYPDKICERCLNELRTVFEFRLRCEVAFAQLIKITHENKQFNEHSIELHSAIYESNAILNDPVIPENIKHEECHIIQETQNIDKINPIVDKPDAEAAQFVSNAETTELEPEQKRSSKRSKIFQCDICDRTFSRPTHLRRHMVIHTDERAFACKLCSKRFRRADHLKNHENYHAQLRPHTCQHCQKSFARAEHLRRHISSRHNGNPSNFACSNCDYIAETSKDLTQHRKSHVEVSFNCKNCDEKFSNKTELNEHNKQHSHERPFLCSECGMRFTRNDYLVIHMRRHKGEKPYKCRFCDSAFPRATDLTVHERYHTNEKKHSCNLCGKGFQRAYNLTVHMRVHTGEKPYQCPHCSKSFSQRNDLKAHVRRHTGERMQCDSCDASFIQTYLLNNHKKNVHGIDAKSHISRLTKFNHSEYNETSEPQAEVFDHGNQSEYL